MIKLAKLIMLLLFFYCMLMIPLIGSADTVGYTGRTLYTPADRNVDVWLGGKIVLDNEFKVKKTDIQSSELLNKTTKFKVSWKLPSGITPTEALSALTTDSYIKVGTQQAQLTAASFTIKGSDEIIYTLSDKTFSLLELVAWLLTLLLNPDVVIQTHIELDVTKLSGSVADNSVNKVITKGKLPPSSTNSMSFFAQFINVSDVIKGDVTTSLATWSQYISPWNQVESASSLNGKDDAIPLEVNSISRVLQGNNYKTRIVQLPINSAITMDSYMRTVNLFSKSASLGSNNGAIKSTAPVMTDTLSELNNGKKQLVREIAYNISGIDTTRIILSPVPLVFKQVTLLDFKLHEYPKIITADQQIKVTGVLESEGRTNQFYFKVNGSEEKALLTVGQTEQNVELTLPKLLEGTNNIVIGVSNEFKLKKEVNLSVFVQKEELKLSSVSNVLNFGEHDIPQPGDVFYSESEFLVNVLDTKLAENHWKVAIALSSRFQTDEGMPLPADVFLEKNGQKYRLTDEFVDVYENMKVNNKTITAIDFKENEGIYLEMNSSNVLLDKEYKGTLEITLINGP